MHAVVGVPPEALVGSVVLICLNDHCGRSLLNAIGPDAGFESGTANFGFADGTMVALGTLTGSVTTTFSLSVQLEGPDAKPAVDGDVYRLQIVEHAGTVLLDASQSVTYKANEVNGPGCGPTCHNAAIDFSPGM
jgi:hypothetical protein